VISVLPVPLLEREPGLEPETRAVEPGLRRVDEQAARPVDDAKEMLVARELRRKSADFAGRIQI
jgi:hypothetical protein